MAFVYKGTGAAVTYHSELANAGPDAMSAHQRQVDTYKLALAGSRDCRRLWSDFAAEQPAIARLVVADVQGERQRGAEVSRSLDGRLAEAEKLVTKGRKAKKITKARKKAPAAGAGLDALGQARALLADPVLAHSNPVHREWAYEAALRRG